MGSIWRTASATPGRARVSVGPATSDEGELVVHPSDPRHPHGGADQFGETQIGAPTFHPAGTPQPYPQPGPSTVPPQSPPPPPQPPQHGQPQYTPQQPQYRQPQYGQPQYGQPQQFAPQQFGPGQFAPFPPGQLPAPPRRRRTPLILTLVGSVVLIAALTTLLIVAPWESSTPAETTGTFQLSDGVTAEVRLPSGWEASGDSENGEPVIRIHRGDDDRPLTQVNSVLASLKESGTGGEVHSVFLVAGTCSSSTSTKWTPKNSDKSSPNHVERWYSAVSKVDDATCIGLTGVDAGVGSDAAGSEAHDLVRQLISEDRVTGAKPV